MCTSTYYGIFLGKDFERFVWLTTSLFYIYIYIYSTYSNIPKSFTRFQKF